MSKFKSIIDNIPPLSSIPKLTADEVAAIQLEIEGVPKDYCDFLVEVGFGDLGEIQIYNMPALAETVYGSAKGLSDIVIFGDDHQGYCFGFDRRYGYRIVEIDPKGKLERPSEQSFMSLLESYFGPNSDD